MVGARYDLRLDYDDRNGNDRVDLGEPFLGGTNIDGTAAFDWGVTDVDASRSGQQEVRARQSRNGWTEQMRPAWWHRYAWPHDYVKFTTGPDTTSVQLFFDTRPYTGTQEDADVAIDSVHLRPVVSPHRTLAVRPAEGQAGETTITLTARDAEGDVMGTDELRLRVGAGSLRDGAFEAGEAATPWELSPTAEIANVDPFRVDHQLQLGVGTNEAASQQVTTLAANARYRLEVTGRVERAGGELAAYVQGHGGPQAAATLTGTTTGSTAVEFTTAAGVTSAQVVLADWNAADGRSFVEGVSLRKCATVTSCESLTGVHSLSTPPDLASVGTRRGVTDEPIEISAMLPAGATVTGVTSTNEALVADGGITVTGPGRRKTFTLTPIPDRSGATKLRVAYTGAPGSPVEIPVVVSDRHLRQPGFEDTGHGWALAGSAAPVEGNAHGGRRSLQVNGTGDARQVVDGLPQGTDYVLRAHVDGQATVTVRSVPVVGGEQPEVLATATFTGEGWTERELRFQTLRCTDDCKAERWRDVEVVVADAATWDGVPVRVDDLTLIRPPALRRIRDISLASTETSFDTVENRRPVVVGRLPEHALWDANTRSVGVADVPGFGSRVVTAADVRGPSTVEHAWPHAWAVDVKAGAKTGRSEVTVTLTDPGTGLTTKETFAVTVNAGDNFDNGDFQRSTLGATNTGWTGAWINDGHEIMRKQSWWYLGIHSADWTYAGPRDDDKVLRLTSGAVKHPITGLQPGTTYRVRLRAKGSGSSVSVRTHDDVLGSGTLGMVRITPPNQDNVWRDYTFTFTTAASGPGSTDVALLVMDDNMTGPAEEGTLRACALFAAGESCFDDFAVMRLADVG
jgi:hypothetical protein